MPVAGGAKSFPGCIRAGNHHPPCPKGHFPECLCLKKNLKIKNKKKIVVSFEAGVYCAHGASRFDASARSRFVAAQPISVANEEMNHTGSRERRKFTAKRRKQSRYLLRGQVETPLSALEKCKTELFQEGDYMGNYVLE